MDNLIFAPLLEVNRSVKTEGGLRFKFLEVVTTHRQLKVFAITVVCNLQQRM